MNLPLALDVGAEFTEHGVFSNYFMKCEAEEVIDLALFQKEVIY